jgi:hypothetical protein
VPDALNAATLTVIGGCFGDIDCGGSINSIDALKLLRHGAGLTVTQSEPCENVGTMLGVGELQGDIDCSGTVNSIDALKLLRYGAGLSVDQTQPCPLPNS